MRLYNAQVFPLWEKVARTKCVLDEGSLPAETNPLPGSILLRFDFATLSQCLCSLSFA
jgi:hypothetical protein